MLRPMQTGSKVNIEVRRLNLGLTAKAAAEQIGIPDHVLRYAETTGQPRPATAKKIADFYGLLVTDIWPVVSAEPAAA